MTLIKAEHGVEGSTRTLTIQEVPARLAATLRLLALDACRCGPSDPLAALVSSHRRAGGLVAPSQKKSIAIKE